jgi:hypothetical protein
MAYRAQVTGLRLEQYTVLLVHKLQVQFIFQNREYVLVRKHAEERINFSL